MRGDDISDVVSSPLFASYPDDVRILASSLASWQKASKAAPLTLDIDNCGTAMRFLTAFFAAQPDADILLTGCSRMQQRPIGQLVDALRSLGADIAYAGQDGFPPLRIRGKALPQGGAVSLNVPQSTQFISALLLIGVNVQTDACSPYIDMTRAVMRDFQSGKYDGDAALDNVEGDWSSAAFWLEREALGLLPEGITFANLRDDSLQGDRVAVDLFRRIRERSLEEWDFSACPDLYPAAAVACRLLGLAPRFTGLESLRIKESDRLSAIEANFRRIDRGEFPLCSYADHRIAMVFLAAGYPVDYTACIAKSYPAFLSQLLNITRVVAVREGDPVSVFRDGLLTIVQKDGRHGKKWALTQALPQVTTDYVWLTDADIDVPSLPALLLAHYRASSQSLSAPWQNADMMILPLRMRPAKAETGNAVPCSLGVGATLLDRLQMLEYDAIQSLTQLSAEHHHPVMCAGANLIVRKDAWFACLPDIHPDIPSGDDMFILESMKRRGMQIACLSDKTTLSKEYTATCTAAPSLDTLLRQRMRWAGKAPHYTDCDIILCGGWTVLSNLLVVFSPQWLLLKWIADMLLIRRRRMADGRSLTPRSCLDGLLLTAFYPWYMLICLIGGLRRKKW